MPWSAGLLKHCNPNSAKAVLHCPSTALTYLALQVHCKSHCSAIAAQHCTLQLAVQWIKNKKRIRTAEWQWMGVLHRHCSVMQCPCSPGTADWRQSTNSPALYVHPSSVWASIQVPLADQHVSPFARGLSAKNGSNRDISGQCNVFTAYKTISLAF